jgi:hypothetical protein
VGEGGVDGVAEVLAGVDEGAVEVEDEEARVWRERHVFRINRWSRVKGRGVRAEV